MDALLTDRWLDGSSVLSIVDEASVAVAREEIRLRGEAHGLSKTAVAELAIAVSELAHNQLRHARLGRIGIATFVREGAPGLEIVAVDRGPGILDPVAAIEGPAPGTRRGHESLGAGLSSVLRLCDEVDFDVRVGEGTCIRARKIASNGDAGPPRRRREVAIYGRPYPGEDVSGDDAVFVRNGDRLLLAVADGLGHGPLARSAARAAIDVVARSAGRGLVSIFEEAHRAAEGTRGTVLTVVDIDEHLDELEHAAIGNAVTHVVGPDGSRAYAGPSLVVGARGATIGPRLRPERQVLRPRDVVFAFTDGLTSRTRLDRHDDVLRAHPIAIAARLVEQFSRENDDVTVVVAR